MSLVQRPRPTNYNASKSHTLPSCVAVNGHAPQGAYPITNKERQYTTQRWCQDISGRQATQPTSRLVGTLVQCQLTQLRAGRLGTVFWEEGNPLATAVCSWSMRRAQYIRLSQNRCPYCPNYLQNKLPYFQQHVGLKSNLINATQSSMPADKYGMIGPYSLFRET